MNKYLFKLIFCLVIVIILISAIVCGCVNSNNDSAEVYEQIESIEIEASAPEPSFELIIIEEEESFNSSEVSIIEESSEESFEEVVVIEEIVIIEEPIEEVKEIEVEEWIPASEYYWDGEILTPTKGVNWGPSGKETYYNLPMDGIIEIMRVYCNNYDEHWIREDGCHMLGDYIMVAADLSIRPRGSFVPTSLGMGIVCDTGGFIYIDPYQLDIAVVW